MSEADEEKLECTPGKTERINLGGRSRWIEKHVNETNESKNCWGISRGNAEALSFGFSRWPSNDLFAWWWYWERRKRRRERDSSNTDCLIITQARWQVMQRRVFHCHQQWHTQWGSLLLIIQHWTGRNIARNDAKRKKKGHKAETGTSWPEKC